MSAYDITGLRCTANRPFAYRLKHSVYVSVVVKVTEHEKERCEEREDPGSCHGALTELVLQLDVHHPARLHQTAWKYMGQ